jgi:hypothetical protein
VPVPGQPPDQIRDRVRPTDLLHRQHIRAEVDDRLASTVNFASYAAAASPSA